MANTHSAQGLPYAKLSELKAGDLLVPDGGFTCLRAAKPVRVEQTESGCLFVPCKDGQHFLDGQADDGEHITGMHKV